MDMGFRGQKFTWTNYKEGDENIKKWIDRAMCNVEWRRRFERAIVFHEPMIGSDHTLLRIELDGQRNTKMTPFKFDKRWLEYPRCSEVVRERWDGVGSCHNKLKLLSRDLKLWSRNEVGNSKQNINRIQGEIEALMGEQRTAGVIEREKADDTRFDVIISLI
ncbi:hypothetical protein LINPERPRIM_LOCUS5416 [Linum perenne]